jgi:hypothetical protein
MTCNGWTAQFSFTKSTDQRVDNYILRANMNNKWATTPQDPLWFLQDGSDQARSTGNVNSFSTTVIPFRHYFDWSLQSVINNVETTKTYNSGSTSYSPAFTCIPEYVLPVGVTAQNCTNTDGALKSECNFDVFRGEYRRQYGYSQQNTGYYPNLISGKNAYQTILTDTNKRELIDLLDFEAWRKAKYQTPTTTQAPPTPTNTPTPVPPIASLTRTPLQIPGHDYIATWNDDRGTREVLITKCNNSSGICNTSSDISRPTSCPTASSLGLGTGTNTVLTTSDKWCKYEVKDATSVSQGGGMYKTFRFYEGNINLDPGGRYIIAVNQTVSQSLSCTGNPVCSVNNNNATGAANCSPSTSCSTSDFIYFNVPVPPTPTNTPTVTPTVTQPITPVIPTGNSPI